MIYTTTDPMSGRVSLKLHRSRSMLLTAISNSCWVTRQLQAVLCHKWLLLRRVRVASTDVGTWKGHTMQCNATHRLAVYSLRPEKRCIFCCC